MPFSSVFFTDGLLGCGNSSSDVPKRRHYICMGMGKEIPGHKQRILKLLSGKNTLYHLSFLGSINKAEKVVWAKSKIVTGFAV